MSEATLLTAMEHPPTQGMDRAQGKILEETGGLGTPATRADVIEKLFSAFYMERRGEGESQFFACVCGHREKLSGFKKKRETGAAGKRDVQRYLQNQEEGKGASAMAEQLKKWLEQQEK